MGYILGLLLLLVRVLWPPLQLDPDLVVQLQDAAAQPVTGVTVTLVDMVSDTVVATTTTDATGSAAFRALPVGAVRVRVTGSLPDGTALQQLGQDADGVVLYLGPNPNHLALVVETDGLVRPDPATMLAPDAAGVPVETPLLPTALPRPTSRPPYPAALPPTLVVPTAAPLMVTPALATPQTAPFSWVWTAIAILLSLVGLVIVLLGSERRAS